MQEFLIYGGFPYSERSGPIMSEPEPIHLREEIPVVPRITPAPPPRAIGSPLSMGSSSRSSVSSVHGNGNRLTSAPAPARALPGSAAQAEESSGLQRAVNAFRTVMPIVQRILPLLDSNIAAAVGNFLAPHPHPQAPAAAKVDLAPLEGGLAELQTQHRDLRDQVFEQSTTLKRVEDRLEMVREATDRNTLEQQELLEDLKAFSGKVKVVAAVGLGLIAAGFLLELLMFFHLQHVLP
jgi:hypothetical protein